MPRWLLQRWAKHYGLEETAKLVKLAQQPGKLILRAARRQSRLKDWRIYYNRTALRRAGKARPHLPGSGKRCQGQIIQRSSSIHPRLF